MPTVNTRLFRLLMLGLLIEAGLMALITMLISVFELLFLNRRPSSNSWDPMFFSCWMLFYSLPKALIGLLVLRGEVITVRTLANFNVVLFLISTFVVVVLGPFAIMSIGLSGWLMVFAAPYGIPYIINKMKLIDREWWRIN